MVNTVVVSRLQFQSVLLLQVVWTNVQMLYKHRLCKYLVPLMVFNGFEQGFIYADYTKVIRREVQ